jgi:hypothetical protein
MLNVGDIDTFEKARTVFIRSTARIEAAKKHFILDGLRYFIHFLSHFDFKKILGYVTDHATLLQEHSKLYHYLTTFETETKRKLAMESRRIELLSPLLLNMSKASFEVLHKQVINRYLYFLCSFQSIFLDFVRTWRNCSSNVRH